MSYLAKQMRVSRRSRERTRPFRHQRLHRYRSQVYSQVDRESGLGTIRAVGKIYESLRRRAKISDSRARQLIRVGRKQLNAQNQPVTGAGTGRRLTKPDIAYIDTQGRRINIEIDTDPNSSARHQTSVNAADGQAINYFLIIDPWTGAVLEAYKRTPGRGTQRLAYFRQSRLPSLAT